MPPRKRIFREDILKAAVQLVQEEGTAALSMRNIARTLRCSTQPIYSEFENMETLREELVAYTDRVTPNFLAGYSSKAKI